MLESSDLGGSDKTLPRGQDPHPENGAMYRYTAPMDIEQIATTAANLIAMRTAKELSGSAYAAAKARIEEFAQFLKARLPGRPATEAEAPDLSTEDESSLRDRLVVAMNDDPSLGEAIASEVAKVTADPGVNSFITNVLPGGRVDKVINIGEAGDVHIA